MREREASLTWTIGTEDWAGRGRASQSLPVFRPVWRLIVSQVLVHRSLFCSRGPRTPGARVVGRNWLYGWLLALSTSPSFLCAVLSCSGSCLLYTCSPAPTPSRVLFCSLCPARKALYLEHLFNEAKCVICLRKISMHYCMWPTSS